MGGNSAKTTFFLQDNTCRDLSIEAIKEPKRSLSQKEKQDMGETLLQISRSGFGTNMTRDDVINHVFEKPNLLYLIRDGNKMIGFSSFREFYFGPGKETLYLDGTVVTPDCQGRGIFRRVSDAQIARGTYDYVTMRTQNPIVYGATCGLGGIAGVFPNKDMIEGRASPVMALGEGARDVALQVAERLGMHKFNPDTFVERGTYGVALNNPIPYHKTASKLFDNVLNLNYHNGDSVLIVAPLSKK